MKNMKFKLLMIFLLSLSFYVALSINGEKVHAATLPQITFVGIDHSPLVQGDTEAFYITSESSSLVQYRVFLYTSSTDKWDELTNGYSNFVNPKDPFKISSEHKYNIGSYKVSVWVRGVNSSSKYDNYYVLNLNCVNKDDNNRVYAQGSLITDKEVYTVGEKVQINGIENINGMKAPYTYKLNVYDAINDSWQLNLTNYKDSIQWTPTQAGIYVIDLWSISSNSSLWNLLKHNDAGRYYEAWKLKIIKVVNKDGTESISKINDINATVILNEAYTLPASLTAKMSDGSVKQVPVTWNITAADTSKRGKNNFLGTVKGYDKKINLNLNVVVKITSENSALNFFQLMLKEKGYKAETYTCTKVNYDNNDYYLIQVTNFYMDGKKYDTIYFAIKDGSSRIYQSDGTTYPKLFFE